jgi:hypothetical protein
MTEPVKPALSPEEWKDVLQRNGDGWNHARLTDYGEAAALLYHSGFGFTREDVFRLEAVATLVEDLKYFQSGRPEMLRDIAQRIAALLPPETT